MTEISENGAGGGDSNELEMLLAEKIRLDSMLMEKFSRKVTIMFTDIKGSTSYYETRGDLAGRTMIHQHNSIVLPIIEKHGGTLLKTIGDATMSIYETAAAGLQAAREIQTSLLAHNQGRPSGEQIRVRCGLNCGIGLVENKDVYGDVVNVTARIESLASAGDIFISEQVYDELRNDDDFIFRFVDSAKVKGKDEPIKVYRLVWNSEDLRLGTTRGGGTAAGSTRKVGYYLLEVALSGNRLKVSGCYQNDGDVQPVKQCQEVPFHKGEVEACIDLVIAIFNQAGTTRVASNDHLIELKQLGGALYRALIPEVIGTAIADAPSPNLLVSMDESLVRIPWEILHDGTRFLNQKFGIGRTVATSQAVSGSTRAVTRPLRMLLLCDPQGNLPGAAREKQEIIAATEGRKESIAVNAREYPITTGYVSGRIHSYDIVHYAGHAEQGGDGVHGGWQLQDGPLSPAAVSALAGELPMPALVFSNACHTSEWKSSDSFVQRVFSLANAFLLSGVQHYIGTFLDVPDEPSCHFATRFYANLVQGATVGEAMLGARMSLMEKFGEDTIFWASYLLYGDPTTRYITSAAGSTEGDGTAAAPLLRGAATNQSATPTPAPAKSSPAMMIAGGVLALACIAAGYFMFGGSRQVQVQVVQPPASQQNAESDRQMDELVASLAASYRSGTVPKAAQPSDGWTTPPLSFVIMEISGGNDALVEKLNQGIAATAGISIVERKLLNKMLTELKLSASALTDPATSVKLGKILSARVMVSGTLSAEGGKSALMLKFIDTETTEVRKMMAVEAKGKEIDKSAVEEVAGQVAAWVKEEFPVQGKVVATAPGQAKVNIGRQHGLKKGDLLEAVAENGRGSGIYTALAELQLSDVEKSGATAQIRGDGKGLEKDMKVRLKR